MKQWAYLIAGIAIVAGYFGILALMRSVFGVAGTISVIASIALWTVIVFVIGYTVVAYARTRRASRGR
jgi:hypothetical protein